MTLQERLRQIATALPSDDSGVTFTRADLLDLIDGEAESQTLVLSDMTVEEVAAEVKRSPSTVRTWLIAGDLRGYKLNGRDWRVTRSALREYLDRQATRSPRCGSAKAEAGLGAWKRIRAQPRESQ